jgi:hypothetical protein
MPLLVTGGREYIVILIPKNGTSTINRAIDKAGYKRTTIGMHLAAADNKTKFVMWREPEDRIESAFRMYRENNEHYGVFADWVLRICDRINWEETIRDGHITPQWMQCMWEDQFVPTKIIRWNFAEFSAEASLPPMSRRYNASYHWPTKWTDEARASYRERYAKDFEIWGAH